MSNEDPNVTVAKFSFKQAIVVAAITGITTLGGAFLTMKSGSSSEDSKDSDSKSVADEACAEEAKQLKADLGATISFSSLADISNRHFGQSDDKSSVKNSLRSLVVKANELEENQKHFTNKLFRLKKLMLTNGGNINVRVSSVNVEACRLIQDLLKGLESYRGTIDGNVESTREAVESFQRKLNQYTPEYFAEKNIGIVGKKTFNAILERYEKND